jgi:tRNA1(Val) A37 N6-methylase TrmN6
VLLAAFAPASPGARALDIGCGVGTAGLCLAARVGGVELHGLELQPAYAALARRNAAENGLAMAVHQGDLRRPPPELRASGFDLVLMNPPFHPAEAAVGARDPGRDAALREGGRSFRTGWRRACAGCRPGGTLARDPSARPSAGAAHGA